MERHGRFILQQVERTPDDQQALLSRLATSLDDQLNTLAATVKEMEASLASADTFTTLGALSLFNHLTDHETYDETTFHGKSFVPEYVTLLALKGPYRVAPAENLTLQLLSTLQRQAEAAMGFAHTLQLARYARRKTADAPTAEGGDPSAARAAQGPDALEDLQSAMRMHELGVRNMAYAHHHHAVLEGLFRPVAADLDEVLGFNIDDALRLSRAVVERVDARYQGTMAEADKARAGLLRDVDRARSKQSRASFLEEVASDQDEKRQVYAEFVIELSKQPRDKAVRFLNLRSHEFVFQRSANIYAFTTAELAETAGVSEERTAAFLRALSLDFGSVPESFIEFSQTHPLRTHPFIRHEGRYLCPALMLLDWALQPCFEKALSNAGSKKWERYQRHRHDHVLSVAVELLQRMTPQARFSRNLLYDVDGDPAHEAELDAIAVCDSMAFLVEVKGMPVTPPALRGAPDRLRHDLSKIIGESHEQAVRAKQELIRTRALGESARFRPREGGAEVLVQSGALGDTVLISVTLATLGHITAQLPAESETALFQSGEYSWVVNLFDLMVMADIIDLPAMLPHYVTRRVHAARLGFVEASDELDLFGYYLKEGLYLDDVAAGRGTEEGFDAMRLLSYTGSFDAYYLHTTGMRETPAPKPAQTIPPPLKGLLDRLASSNVPGWLEASLALLDLGGQARSKFAALLERARRITRAERRASSASMGGTGDGGWGITYICAPTLNEVEAVLPRFCEDKRRQVRAERWLCLGEEIESATDRRVVAIITSSEPGAHGSTSRPHRTRTGL